MRGPRRSTALVAGIAQLSAAAGSVDDRQLVIFSRRPRTRPSRCLWHALAPSWRCAATSMATMRWHGCSYRLGRFDEAAVHARAAMALGTPDPRIAYHAGLIAAARGDEPHARSLLVMAVRGVASAGAAAGRRCSRGARRSCRPRSPSHEASVCRRSVGAAAGSRAGAAASADPLGNYTVNRAVAVTIAPDHVALL